MAMMKAGAPAPSLPPFAARSCLRGANVEDAGQHNERVVLQAVRRAGAATRSQLAETTGLTGTTIAKITDRLARRGLLSRASYRRGGRGQPAARVNVNSAGAFAFGVDVDPATMTMVLVDFDGSVLDHRKNVTARPTSADVRAFFGEHAQKMLDDSAVPANALAGIGLTVPRALRQTMSHIERSDAAWQCPDFASLLTGPSTAPTIVEHAVAAAAIGEIQFGLGQEQPNFFYLLLGSGLMGGVVINSIYDSGAGGRGGEIGLLMVPDGRGGQTQLQTIVSLTGLSRAMADANIRLDCIFADRIHDHAAEHATSRWVDQAAQALIHPLRTVGCLLNPGAVVIGGGLPRGLIDRLARRTNTMMQEAGEHLPGSVEVQSARLANDAAAVGAALLTFGHLMPSARTDAPQPAAL